MLSENASPEHSQTPFVQVLWTLLRQLTEDAASKAE
jgi:hypothetical protein